MKTCSHDLARHDVIFPFPVKKWKKNGKKKKKKKEKGWSVIIAAIDGGKCHGHVVH